MRLGTIELTRRKVDPFVAAAIRRAVGVSPEPIRSLLDLAVLGIACSGPRDWPEYQEGIPFEVFGQSIRSYLSLAGVDVNEALMAGAYARRGLKAGDINLERANEYADFFGVPRDFLTESPLPSDTSTVHSAA